MHNTFYLLFVCIFPFGHAYHDAVTGAIDSTHLLLDGFPSLGDYEILDVREEGDEDVIRIRKRAEGGDCGSDCLNYSGWEEDEVMHCDSEDMEEADSPERRSSLQKRGRKKAKDVCRGVATNNGGQLAGFHLYSPTYTRLDELIKSYGKVYDTGDPQKPFDKEWFEVKNRKTRWGGTCRYATEHILEWQLLQDFIEGDKGQGSNSRCAHLQEWFLGSMPTSAYKVKVAKNDGELQKDNHFEYEDKDYGFGGFKFEAQNPRYIDWIAFQWPGQKSSSPQNPWEYELVVLNRDLNLKKENVWGDKKFFVEPNPDRASSRQMSQKNQENSKTLEWLFENKYFDGGQNTKYWPDNKGKCKAVYLFNTAMGISQYHSDLFVKEAFRAHALRVGEAWELIEKDVLAHKIVNGQPYKERGLKKEWLDWIAETHKDRLGRLNKAMEEKIKVFEAQSNWSTKLKRWDYSGVFRRATKEPDCGSEPSNTEMQKRVDMLIKAYGDMDPVEIKLKLD